jgi:hypothetical protein
MSSKTRFLARSANVSAIANMLASANFEEACDVAVCEFMEQHGLADKIETAAAKEWQRQGAMKMLMVLKSIATPRDLPPNPITSTLRTP